MPARQPSPAAIRDTAAHLLGIFQRLAAQRTQREEVIPGRTGGQELAWHRYELNGMLAAVNLERAWVGDPAVVIDLIEQADQQACGHCDYAAKFTFYCAEIVYGISPLTGSMQLKEGR